MTGDRPPLDASLTGTELRRWYWLRAELVGLARELGVSTSGGKIELTERLAAALDGQQPPAARPRPQAADPLPPQLSGSTVLPPNQRSTQALRAWFVAEIGPSFRFDASMRSFIAAGGHTLDEAVHHWYASRGRPPAPIDAQFELNRFARAWHAEHPRGSHAEMLAAWRTHRSLPTDQRRPMHVP